MDSKDLVTAMLAAIPFASKDVTRPQLAQVAVSQSRVRAANGHVAVHIWDKSIGDKDLGPVVSLDVRDVKTIARLAGALRPRAPRKSRRRFIPSRPAADLVISVEPTECKIGPRSFPYFHPVTTAFVDSDKVIKMPETASTAGAWNTPAYVAMAGECAAALGVVGVVFASNGPVEAGVFYGETATLCMAAIVMPTRPVLEYAECRTRRLNQIKPPPPPPPPKTEEEILRDRVAELEAQLAAKSAA